MTSVSDGSGLCLKWVTTYVGVGVGVGEGCMYVAACVYAYV